VSRTGYLTLEDIVPPNFLKRPTIILAEFGNGMGKTYTSCKFAVSAQQLGIFDRIYIMQYSQKGCENVVKKIESMGGKCVWHIGLEKFCPRYEDVKRMLELGIPPSYACFLCPYFRGKSKAAFRIFQQEVENEKSRIIKPKLASEGLLDKRKVCTHPIIRSFVLEPSTEIEKKLTLKYPPIIVAPSQILLNHAIVGRWKAFASRQRKPRKILMIVDEADTVFYAALKTEIPIIEASEVDREILRLFSTKSRKLEKLLDYYSEITNILQQLPKRRNRVDKSTVEKIEQILKRADVLLRSFNRRRKEIVAYVLNQKIRTRIFKVVNSLEEMQHIERLDLALKTVEVKDGKILLYDYEFGIRILFDPDYPWKHFWKVNLSATFPTEKIVESEFLSPQAKKLILKAAKRTRTYENVYVGSCTIFESGEGLLNRNAEIEYSVPRILNLIKEAVAKYEESFGFPPNGICLWFGNSTQLRKFLAKLKQARIRYRRGKSYAIFYYGKIPIFCSYCGSSLARGIDLQQYDISIVVGPLLRPPRPTGVLDVIDFARGVAEAIQSAMRIVRSPCPPGPKVVILEKHMTNAFYAHFYPEWFKVLAMERVFEI